MQISALAQRILNLVFVASSARTPLSRPRLGRQSGSSRSEVNRALDELARRGLLDAQRLRLTLSGLAIAVATGARTESKPRATARESRRESAVGAPIALFSQREPPRAVA